MPSFAKFRKGKRIAQERADARAVIEEGKGKSASGPSSSAYKHVISHAAVDALSGAPSSFKVEDKSAIKYQWERRRGMVASSRNHSFRSNSTTFDSPDGSDSGRTGPQSVGDSWADRGSRQHHQSLNLSMSREASRMRRGNFTTLQYLSVWDADLSPLPENEAATTSSSSASSSGSEHGLQVRTSKRYPQPTDLTWSTSSNRPHHQSRTPQQATGQAGHIQHDQFVGRRSGLMFSESAGPAQDADATTPASSSYGPAEFPNPSMSRFGPTTSMPSPSRPPVQLQLPRHNMASIDKLDTPSLPAPLVMPSPTHTPSIHQESSHPLSKGSPYLPSSPYSDHQARDYFPSHYLQSRHRPRQLSEESNSPQHLHHQQMPPGIPYATSKPPTSRDGATSPYSLDGIPQTITTAAHPPSKRASARPERGSSRESSMSDSEAPPVPDIPVQVRSSMYARHKQSPSLVMMQDKGLTAMK